MQLLEFTWFEFNPALCAAVSDHVKSMWRSPMSIVNGGLAKFEQRPVGVVTHLCITVILG